MLYGGLADTLEEVRLALGCCAKRMPAPRKDAVTPSAARMRSPAGRTDVSPERYAELMAAARPDLILAIADIQSAHVSTKRHAKAVERTKACVPHPPNEGTTNVLY